MKFSERIQEKREERNLEKEREGLEKEKEEKERRLKQWVREFRREKGRAPSLSDFKENEESGVLLQRIESIKKTLNRMERGGNEY